MKKHKLQSTVKNSSNFRKAAVREQSQERPRFRITSIPDPDSPEGWILDFKVCAGSFPPPWHTPCYAILDDIKKLPGLSKRPKSGARVRPKTGECI
jgi:hypothetical protein